MNSIPEVQNNPIDDDNFEEHRRQRKALNEFKEILEDLVGLFQEASGVETIYLYWVNRNRRQFVMETKATVFSDIVFQDRVRFSEHFLDDYRDIMQPVSLKVGEDISPDELMHYQGDLPVECVSLLPFFNNKETVAITVVESVEPLLNEEKDKAIQSYINALRNILNTYLEISDLHENQNEWVTYQEQLHFLEKKGHYVELLKDMLDTMQQWVNQGGVSLVSRGMGTWSNTMNAAMAEKPIPLGLELSRDSIAGEALRSGDPQYAVHFNRNPKRLSPREAQTEGASLAVPLKFEYFRKGVVLVYDENPLLFKESSKHKFINTVKLTNLKIQARLRQADEEPLLSNSTSAFIPDLWKRALDTEIERSKNKLSSHHTWVGMITPSKLSQIRTQLRLEDLKLMQKDLVKAFNPENFGVPGLIGYHADYIYAVILQSNDPEAFDYWTGQLKKKFNEPFELTNGKQIQTGVSISAVSLDQMNGDSYKIMKRLKRELSKQNSG
ncbi:MAG TPA: GAF domain-containing protein [Balneolaceae bacterium]|nr:GAF domain-containing protein [Balneolaceae bacterium]